MHCSTHPAIFHCLSSKMSWCWRLSVQFEVEETTAWQRWRTVLACQCHDNQLLPAKFTHNWEDKDKEHQVEQPRRVKEADGSRWQTKRHHVGPPRFGISHSPLQRPPPCDPCLLKAVIGVDKGLLTFTESQESQSPLSRS
jgi:hypothetical protein